MKEAEALSGVSRFHRTFDLPIRKEPVIPSSDRCHLRINLLQEELDELQVAIQENDLVEVADALCDIQYVLSGAILEFGLGDRFAELFAEVQRSNMSKVCESREVAEATLSHYREHKNTEGYIVERDGEYLVYRKSDNKVLKSVNYSPADLAGMLSEKAPI
jgi:predicted HAD superfamily Cof-like phosphohydrolase